MDVRKLLGLVFVLIITANCQGNKRVGSDQFKRSSQPQCDDQARPGEYLVQWKNGDVTIENFSDDESFIEEFLEQNKEAIEFAEPHYKILVSHGVEVAPLGYGGQINWGVDAIQAASGWGKTSDDEAIIVAVVDSGLDITHPQFQGAIAVNENEIANGIDDDNNGLIDDINGYNFADDSGEMYDNSGHGTHVAGIIAARHELGVVKGVAPKAKILPLNFITASGAGSVDSAIRALRYAGQRGAKVINASWGGSSCSSALKNEIEALAQKNILFVAAAGNEGNDLSVYPEYPAGFVISNMVSVGAATYDFKTADFSNYGSLVDLVAPGANIISTFPPDYDVKDGSRDGFQSLDGTSMAAPFVTAAAALLWAHKPGASFVEIKQALLQGIQAGPYPVKTRGMLNVEGALSQLSSTP
ncbi:MAG: S8 family serine peptidase [Bdellovibrionales bacterium]|nr:S8 family serine peptidase [Bdellovibrionales bacterium]